MSQICSIEGCSGEVVARGWCGKHWFRWRWHGDPLAGKVFRGEPVRYMREVVLAYDGDECLIWPYLKDVHGYGKFFFEKKTCSVHRIVCTLVHGPAPTAGHQAAHACGKGHEGCVAPNHLSWKTRTENEADKIFHGTRYYGEKVHAAKLRSADVVKIRALLGEKTQQEIADFFGVSQSTIAYIKTGRNWRSVQS